MTPEELAALHPELYHITASSSLDGILANGLLPTTDLLTLFEIPREQRLPIELACRPRHVQLHHRLHGTATITDNTPLSINALSGCLDDGMKPADWLRELNRRVFFWANQAGVNSLLNAKRNRARDLTVLVLSTLSVARDHHACIEISPINSGATIRRPARRGRSTFAKLPGLNYIEWRRQRGQHDRIREVTVVGGLSQIARHLIGTQKHPGAAS